MTNWKTKDSAAVSILTKKIFKLNKESVLHYILVSSADRLLCSFLDHVHRREGDFITDCFPFKKVHQSHDRPEVRRGFQEVKGPRLRDNGPGWW